METATVTVVEQIVEIEPELITITPDTATLNITEIQQFNATVLPEGANQGVNWSIDNGTVGTINATGYFIANAIGTVNVTATSTAYTNITETTTVTVVEIPTIKLQDGWNLISTPFVLNESNNSLNELMGDITWIVAYSFYDTTEQWMMHPNGAEFILNPLDAIYIYVETNTELEVELVSCSSLTYPPSRELSEGWNLISLASLESMCVSKAMMSVYEAPNRYQGYIQIINPIQNQNDWIFIRNDEPMHYMHPTEGYWIFMDNQDILAGFTTTPL